MTPIPNATWKEISMDFVSSFPSGNYLVVVTDAYNRFHQVEIVTSTSARATHWAPLDNSLVVEWATLFLNKDHLLTYLLDDIFAKQGIPEVLKSDNGPPFNSNEFQKPAEHSGFEHRRITPYWPIANGETERFIQTLENCIRAAYIEGKDWEQEMYTFLQQFRVKPHSTTGMSPREALNNRQLKINLLEIQLRPTRSKNRMTIIQRDTD